MDTGISDSTTDWSLTAVGGYDFPAIIILTAAVGALALWTWRSLDPAFPFSKRAAITIIRSLALIMGLVLLLQPSFNIRELQPQTGEFAVLVDVSESMTRGGDRSRLAQVKSLLEQSRSDLADLAQNKQLSWYIFGDGLHPVDSEADIKSPEKGHLKTDIKGALKKLIEKREQPLDGVVIISDGADTEPPFSRTGVADQNPSLPRSYDTSWAERGGLAINTVFIGSQREAKDLAIIDVHVDPIAFTRSETPIVVRLQSTGLPDRDVEAFLWQNGAVVQRKSVPLMGGQSQFAFTLFPSSLGHQVSTVTIPLPEDDEIPENNVAHVSYEVVRDKYRILQLSGHPSWDQRFLRQTLKAWPKVDLVSFYILRTTHQSENLGSDGMALIPFPTQELFEGHLEEFDVIIFQGFDPTVVGVDRYLDDIASFVKKGGALVILSGSGGLGIERAFSRTLAEVLPLKLLEPQTAQVSLVEETPFRLQLSEGGTGHPLMQLAVDPEENRKIWQSLLRLDGIARVASMAKGGYRLAEHPSLLADDGPAPVFAVKETEKGRTLMITTDSLWRWRYTNPMQGGPADVHSRFWQQAIAWLTRSPELERLRLDIAPAKVQVGRTTQMTIELKNQAYQPMPGLDISYEVSWFDGNDVKQRETFQGVLDNTGRYKTEWTPKREGPYQLTVTGDGLTKSKLFLAISSQAELKHLAPNPRFLEVLAENTGGYFDSGTLTPEKWVTRRGPAHQVLSHKEISLWDHPLFILCLVGLLAADWILRRKIGLS